MTPDEYAARLKEVGDISMLPKLPRVLQQCQGQSMSVERVLKTAIDLITDYGPETDHRVDICIDDLETMLRNIY